MSNFVKDKTTLSTNKVDLYTGGSSPRYCSSADYNNVAQAALDLRTDGPGWYNVKTYSAKGDGTTDDTTAIQAAINACVSNGGTVHFPPGTYKVTSSLTISAKVGTRFMGSGMRSTKLVWAGSVGGAILDIQGCRECFFGEFALLGDVANPTTVAIKYNGVSPNTSQANTFERVWVENYCAYGFRIGQVAFQCSETVYRQCVFNLTSVAGVSLEDANAVNHNFYNCNWHQHAIGITSVNAGTGGGFNLYGCGFSLGTVCDIQNFPSSRGTVISGVWAESGAAFLQMPQSSTGSTVSLLDCSVNGTGTVTSPHIRVGTGSLNIVGGRYTASPSTFVIGVGNTNGYPVNIDVTGTMFLDGNPFTGSNLAYASIRKTGVKYAAIGGDQGDTIGPAASANDTAGNDLVITSGGAGPVVAAGGKAPGDLRLVGATGVAGTAALAAGAGANVKLLGGPGGTNNGGGGASGGSVYLTPGAPSSGGSNGSIFLQDVSGVSQIQANTSGSTCLFPLTTNTKTLGGSSNYWSNIFASRHTWLGQAIAAAASVTVNPASGGKVRINLSATAITSLTVSAGNDGELLTVVVAQDATGGRSIPTTWTNVRFAAGTYTATATASKIDVLNFVYDSTAAAWLERGRAMNM